MTLALEGIRIIDLCQMAPGSFCTMILSDLGAEVIKIEQPVIGDPQRLAQYKDIGYRLPDNTNLIFAGSNRGKKSITLNLEHQKGRQIAHNLVKKSDVFFTNLRRSTVSKMEMDYSILSQVNQKLIHASVTSYGTSGPDADSGGLGLYGFMDGQKLTKGESDLDPAVLSQVKDLLAKAQKGQFTRLDVFAGPIKDNKGKEIVAAGHNWDV